MLASIWLASSRVGDSTRTRQLRERGCASDSISRPRIGSAKAAVLPVPVWAMPSRSRPARTWGMAPGLDRCGSDVAFGGKRLEDRRGKAEVVKSCQIVLTFFVRTAPRATKRTSFMRQPSSGAGREKSR